MTTIVDYGLGNVSAFVNVFNRLNLPVRVASSAGDLVGSERIILPGVGHFDHAVTSLSRSGMRDQLDALVLREQIPVLGVCVGMQILAGSSDEGHCQGLAWIDARVERLEPSGAARELPVPHMGWNDVEPARSSPLFQHLPPSPRFYFLHSYVVRCADANDVLANTTYGSSFCCAVNSGNIFGVQFHPEKSHEYGSAVLKGFAGISRA